MSVESEDRGGVEGHAAIPSLDSDQEANGVGATAYRPLSRPTAGIKSGPRSSLSALDSVLIEAQAYTSMVLGILAQRCYCPKCAHDIYIWARDAAHYGHEARPELGENA